MFALCWNDNMSNDFASPVGFFCLVILHAPIKGMTAFVLARAYVVQYCPSPVPCFLNLTFFNFVLILKFF